MLWRMDTKRYMTIAEADQAVAALQHGFIDTSLGQLDFRVSEDGKLAIAAEERNLAMADKATNRLVRFLGLPAGVEEEFGDDPSLLTQMLNHSKRKRADTGVRMVKSREKVVAVEEGNTDGISISDVWERVQDLPDIAGVQLVEHTSGSEFELRVISDFLAEPPSKKGDISHAGIHVTVNGVVKAAPYVYTVLCTNGLTATRYGKTIELRRDGTPLDQRLEQIQAGIATSWETARKVLDKFIASDTVKVTNPHAYLLQLMEEAGIGPRDQANLLTRLPELPAQPSVYELTSLVTNFAQSFKRRRGRNRFESFGMDLLVHATSDEHRCSHCHGKLQAK